MTGFIKHCRLSKAFPALSITIVEREDSTSGTSLSRFTELFLVKLKCQKLFYQMLSLRIVAQSKEQLPISKVGPFKRKKNFFFYWYVKLAGSKKKSFISAVSLSATDSYNHMQAAIPFERLFKWTNTKKKEKHKCFHSEWLPRITEL